MKNNSTSPAFPAKDDWHTDGGLSKREYFAIKIAQGLCACKSDAYEVNNGCKSVQPLVNDAIRIADELLKQLEK